MSRSFYAFVATQLLGAFNDNLFKQLILFLAASVLFPGKDLQGLAFAIFSLPFILFSGLAGDLSERFSKTEIIKWMKRLEVLIMALGAIALQMRSWSFMLLVLFIMGAQSAFFGPAKYGSIPEMVDKHQLVKANGTVTMTTFVAVLAGGALAGPLLDTLSDNLWVCGVACILIACLGVVTAGQMTPIAATTPHLRIFPTHTYSPQAWLRPLYSGLFSTIRTLSRREGLLSVVLLNSAYWFNAGVFNQAVVGMGAPELLNIGAGNHKQLSFVLATLSVSVAIGALLAPRLIKRMSAGKLVTLGACAMVAGQLLMNLVGSAALGRTSDMAIMHLCAALTGACGAAVVVPLSAYLQFAPPEGMRGLTFGVTNFFNFICLFLAGVFYLVLRGQLGLSPALVQSMSGASLLIGLWLTRARVKSLDIH